MILQSSARRANMASCSVGAASAGQRGFTLIETMVTMVIISIGLLAMASLLVGTIKQNSSSEHRMDAAAVSQALLSEYAAFDAAGTAWTNPASGTREGYTFTVTGTALSGNSTLLTVQLSGKGLSSTYSNQLVISTAAGN